jgi:hypothetical protein
MHGERNVTVTVFLHPMLPDFRKSIALWKVRRLRPFACWKQKHIEEDEDAALVEWY